MTWENYSEPMSVFTLYWSLSGDGFGVRVQERENGSLLSLDTVLRITL